MTALWVSSLLLTGHCSLLTAVLYNILFTISCFSFVVMTMGFIRCASITWMHVLHHRLIRSSLGTLQTFRQPHSRWSRTLNFRTCLTDPKSSLLLRLTLMTLTEPSSPGRWPRSLCLSHSLDIFWPVAHHDTSCTRLVLLAGLFVVSPRLLIFMTGEPRALLTPLEAFLAFQFGTLLFAVSLGILVNVREPSAIPLFTLTHLKSPSGALYTVHATDDPDRDQFSHPLLAPITGASLLMSLSAYNTTGIGMLSTVFSMIIGIIGMWGLWTVRSIIPSYVAASDTSGFTRSSSLALVGAQNLGQTSAPPPSYLATDLQHRRSRKARGRSSPNRASCSSSANVYRARTAR
jgi:hypothetical protein